MWCVGDTGTGEGERGGLERRDIDVEMEIEVWWRRKERGGGEIAV